MKRFRVFALLFFLSGCASVIIPNYVKDEHPYQKKFYADFDIVSKAAVQTLMDLGWEVSRTGDPSVFEESQIKEGRQTLIFTEVRQTALFFATRYARMNIYLRAGTGNTTDAELRYLTMTSLPFKGFNNYRNDRFAQKFFAHLEALLEPAK